MKDYAAHMEVVVTGPFGPEVHVSADRQKMTHRAMAWSASYTPDELLAWIEFYERMAEKVGTAMYRADVEVLHQARDLLAKEYARP